MSDVHTKAKSFFIAGSSQQALLLLHGFTASPSEVRPTAEILNSCNGCSISSILLPGHGTTPEDLNAVCWQDWYQAVEEELKTLLASYQQVFIGGLSMGGLLALHAGVNLPGLAGVIAMNAPIYYHYAVIPILSNLAGMMTPYYRKTGLSKIRKLEEQGRFAYRVMPLKAFQSMNHLRKIVMQEVNELKIPALILQALQDESVHPRSAEFLFEKIQSQSSRLISLPYATHIATMGPAKETIAQEIAKFMEM